MFYHVLLYALPYALPFFLTIFKMFHCNYILGQGNADKYTKLSRIYFSMECFKADFSQFLSTSVKICLLGGCLGTLHQIQAFPGSSYSFLIF